MNGFLITVHTSTGSLPPVFCAEGELILGSEPAPGVFVLNYEGVMPRHAKIWLQLGLLLLEDLELEKGIHVNGSAISGRVETNYPASVQIGSITLLIAAAHAPLPQEERSDLTHRISHPHPYPLNPRILPPPSSPEVTGRIYRTASPDASAVEESLAPAACLEDEEKSTMAFGMETVEVEMDPQLSTVMDFGIREELARGGMGKIFTAVDERLKRVVALKVSTVKERSKDAQFFSEAEVLAQLAHPNIVPIHSIGTDSFGRPFYSMKLIKGRSLQSILKLLRGGDRETGATYTRERLLTVFRKVCDAVAFAHAKGYLHRDLKPDNVMVGEFGEVLVMDWGLAKRIRPLEEVSPSASPEEIEPETLPYVEGTPHYMSPEQAHGVYGGLDARSDIYSLGGILYAILTKRPPVSGSSVKEVLQKVRNGETTIMVQPRGIGGRGSPYGLKQVVPEALRAVTLKALSREPSSRFQNVAALVADIEAYQNGFATSAEAASVIRQVILLVKRHQTASALLALLLCGAALFTIRLSASEKSARSNALRAERAAHIAADQKLIAEENERLAVVEKQAAMRSEAQSYIALTEAAEQRLNAEEMQKALGAVPEALRGQEWRYLNHLSDSSQRTFEAKGGAEWKDWVPHPTRPGVLVTLRSDNLLRTLDLNSGATEDLLKLSGTIADESLAVSPDAKQIAVVEIAPTKPRSKVDSQQIVVWTISTGEKKPLAKTPDFARALLEFSSDGRRIMKVYKRSRSEGAGLSMFDVGTGALLWQRSGDGAYDAEFIPHSELLTYVSNKGGMELNASDGVPTTRPLIPLAEISDSSNYFIKAQNFFSSVGFTLRHLVGTKAHFDVRLSSPLAGRQNLVVFKKEGVFVTLGEVGDNSAILHVRELGEGAIIQCIPVLIDRQGGREWRLTGHSESNQIAVFRGTTMKVWNLGRFPENGSLPSSNLNARNAAGFAFLNSSNEIIQISGPNPDTQKTEKFSVDVFKIKESRIEKKQTIREQILNKDSAGPSFSASRDGRTVAALASKDGMCFLDTYRVQSDGTVKIGTTPVGSGSCDFIQISPNGNKVVTRSGMYDTHSGKQLQTQERNGFESLNRNSGFRWCWMDNTHVVEIALLTNPLAGSLTSERCLVLWSSERNNPLISVRSPNATSLAASPDGTQFAEGGKDGKIRLRNAETLEIKQTLRVHDGALKAIAWHPTLPYLATAAGDSRVRIWNWATGILMEEYGFFNKPPEQLHWSPDGRILAVGGSARYFLKPTSCEGEKN